MRSISIISLIISLTLIISCQNKVNNQKNYLENNYNHFKRDSLSAIHYNLDKNGLINDSLIITNKSGQIVRAQFWRNGQLINDSLLIKNKNAKIDNSNNVYRLKSVFLLFDSLKQIKLSSKELYNGDSTQIDIYNLPPSSFALVMPKTKFSRVSQNKFKAIANWNKPDEQLWYQIWYNFVDYKSDKIFIKR